MGTATGQVWEPSRFDQISSTRSTAEASFLKAAVTQQEAQDEAGIWAIFECELGVSVPTVITTKRRLGMRAA